MHVYQSFERGCYTVGFYDPTGHWVAVSDHPSDVEAQAQVNYLNGGVSRQQLAEFLENEVRTLAGQVAGYRISSHVSSYHASEV